MEAKQMQLQNFFIFLMDCICIVLSYILASYLRFGNLWGGYTKGIVLLRMGILLMSITLVYFIFNPNRNFFSRTKKQELIAVFRNILIMGAAISMAAFLMQDAQKYSRLVYGYFCGIDFVVMYVSHLLYKKYMNDIYSKGIGGRKVLILTSADRAEGICQNIQVNNSWNIKIVGIVLADEQENMIDRYLDKGKMYVLDDNGIKCECIVTDEGNDVLEIKNIATVPDYQGKGDARSLIDLIVE